MPPVEGDYRMILGIPFFIGTAEQAVQVTEVLRVIRLASGDV